MTLVDGENADSLIEKDVNSIKRFSTEIEINYKRSFDSLYTRMINLVNDRLSIHMDRELEQSDTFNQTIIIPLLEIDLGEISVQFFEKEFEEKFITAFSFALNEAVENALTDVLNEKIRQQHLLSQNMSKADPDKEPNNQNRLNSFSSVSDHTSKEQETFFKKRSEDEKELKKLNWEQEQELILHFLKYGVFPWWANQSAYIQQWFTEASDHKRKQEWLRILFFNQNFRFGPNGKHFIQRLLINCKDDLIFKLIEAIPLAALRKVRETYVSIVNTVRSSMDKKGLRVLFWEETLQLILQHFEPLYLRSNTRGRVDLHLATHTFIEDQKKIGEVIIKEYQNKKEKLPKKNTSTQGNVLEEYYVNNAGLVIIWPFIKNLFERLMLLEDGEFTSEIERERAILLLHYICFGDALVDETELVLNKLFCGLELDIPLDPEFEVLEEEVAEVDQLLATVLNSNPLLKNTSMEGFRESFLQRKGVLKEREGNWILQVEKETHDIILERMPWSFMIVKLPWMPSILSVEW